MKVALVTGASSGIGRQIANTLADSGYRVFGTSRSPAGDTLDNFEMLQLDVTDDHSVQACIAAVIERAGQLDVLVNNAGIETYSAVEEATVDEARWVFETNFFGVLRVTQAALPHMRARKSGCIINISSLAGLGGAPFQGLYSASKGALENLSESLWFEVEPFHIRVALVEPGFFQSEIMARGRAPERSLEAYADARHRTYDQAARLMATSPQPTIIGQTVLAIADGRDRRLRHLLGSETLLARFKNLAPDWVYRQRIRWMFGLDDLFTDLTRRGPAVLGMLVLVAAAMLVGRRKPY